MRVFFFFNDTATTEIYTLSLHDALPISCGSLVQQLARLAIERSAVARRLLAQLGQQGEAQARHRWFGGSQHQRDRKSTRLNSSHANISYAVFCLKKKTDCPEALHTTSYG